MKIECYLSQGCGSEEALRENINKALEAGGATHADVSFRKISPDEAERMGLRGSPSIFISGNAVQPVQMPGFS